MAVTGIGSTYSSVYESVYAAPAKKTAEKDKTKETAYSFANPCASAGGSEEAVIYQCFLRSLQKQVSHVTLETGSALNMKRDNKTGTVTINPKLLEKMQNDPEAEKKYTQLIKDIERAENTGNAYYNALGGCVERSSHWYIDENGKYYHFAYTYRDDRYNKKLRQEARENAEKLIEKNRKKAVEKRKKRKEMAAEKRREIKETADRRQKAEDAAEIPEDRPEKTESEKPENENVRGEKPDLVYGIMERTAKTEAEKEGVPAAKRQAGIDAAGANLDISV